MLGVLKSLVLLCSEGLLFLIMGILLASINGEEIFSNRSNILLAAELKLLQGALLDSLTVTACDISNHIILVNTYNVYYNYVVHIIHDIYSEISVSNYLLLFDYREAVVQ